jgi:hypothetical protein
LDQKYSCEAKYPAGYPVSGPYRIPDLRSDGLNFVLLKKYFAMFGFWGKCRHQLFEAAAVVSLSIIGRRLHQNLFEIFLMQCKGSMPSFDI